MSYGMEMLTRPRLTEALAVPRQTHNLTLEEVERCVATLSTMWEMLGDIVVLAELPSFAEEDLARLEQCTIRFNIWWRDTFGVLFTVAPRPLLMPHRRAGVHLQDPQPPAPR